MIKAGLRTILLLIIVVIIYTCIDPYIPKLKGYESLLVVDGLVTDKNSSYTVKLSRTLQDQNGTPSVVSDAIVFITDDGGAKTYLKGSGGIYKTDSLEFRGRIGRTYTLHVLMNGDEEYESDPCIMQSVPDIDSIYFEKHQELVNNETESDEGIMIYLDSESGDDNKFYRWNFEETWKFKVPNPTRYDYNNESSIVLLANIKEFCWKNRKSDEILIHSVYAGQNRHIEKEPIFFIAADKSDRLLIQYSILVSQYSISKKEYDFWDNLQQVNESGGDIFARQPYSVTSNIHCINDPKKRVLGYFQVSAVKQKRKEIPFSETVVLNLPLYHYPCERIEKEPKDYPTGFGPPVTWDEIYAMFCINSHDYSFVEPKYIQGTTVLQKLVFTRPECANCELAGTRKKPDFWIDLN